MDEASIEFSKTFYRLVFSQKNESICEAFCFALCIIAGHQKAEVRSQLYKFLMIRDVDNFDKITQSDFYTK